MTKQIMVGGVAVGGGAPVTIQSMCNTKTEDAGATIEQILRLEQAGCEIVRVTVPTPEAAEAVETIKNSIHIPLVADIHFDYRLAIAAAEGVPEEYILCGSGAAELIYAFADAVRPQRAAELAPTFAEYSLALARTGCAVARYTLSEKNDFAPDGGILNFLRETRPEVFFLCNPNNPTGRLADGALLKEILALCEKLGTYLFADECFLDLTDGGESLKPFLTRCPRLFILKAFTKSYGMAGVRLGYGLCADAALLHGMSETVPPWNVSTLAQAAGVAALGETEFLEKTRALVRAERARLAEQLAALGFRVIPSDANYLLFRAAPGLDAALREQGILIRNCENYAGLCPGWYRIAVRTRAENEALIRALREV